MRWPGQVFAIGLSGISLSLVIFRAYVSSLARVLLEWYHLRPGNSGVPMTH